MPSIIASEKLFTVVMRAKSAVIFAEGQGCYVPNIQTPFGRATVSYQTRWINRPNKVRMPGHLWIEVIGDGPDLATALPILANIGLIALAAIAVACNAAIDDPEIELAFESTEGISERQYFQAYVRPESNHVSSSRVANPQAIAKLIDAVGQNEHHERLLRAENQYRVALDYWKVGSESLVLSHLWMAVEALTKIQIRVLQKSKAASSEKALAEMLGIHSERYQNDLNAAIRRDFLLNGDDECYTKAKEASDGFEHGYLSFPEIHSRASLVAQRLSAYVRASILRLSDLSQDVVDVLMNHPYDEPIGGFPLIKFIRATLIGDSNVLAKEGNTYPIVRWSSAIKSCERKDDGTMDIQFNEQMTPELANGISIQFSSVQIWKGGSGINLGMTDPPDKGVALYTSTTPSYETPPSATAIGRVILTIDDESKKWAQPLGVYVLNVNSIRNLALFWLRQLGVSARFFWRQAPFPRLVTRINRAVARMKISDALKEECSERWKEAIALDRLRLQLARAVTTDAGLHFEAEKYGGTPVLTDVRKLVELNDKAIQLATRIAELFKELERESQLFKT